MPVESAASRPFDRLRPADPRASLVVTIAIVVTTFVGLKTTPGMLIALAYVCALLLVASGRLSALAIQWRRLAPFMLLVVGLNGILVEGEPLFSIAGRVAVSREGLADGVFFALRLAVMVLAVTAFVHAASPEAHARGVHDLLRRVSRPAARRLALYGFLSMSFVPLFAEEFERIRVAQSFRGGDFSGGLLRRVQSARAWLVPLLLSAIHRSGQLAMAVELRGIAERLPAILAPPRARAADAGLLLVTAAVLVVASAAGR